MRTALITGGARRLGECIARALAARGFAVAIHYESSDKEARALVRAIEAAGGDAVALRADLTSPRAIIGLVHEAADALSTPVCLVNNASTFLHDTALAIDPDQWQRQFDINVRAPALLSQAFLQALTIDMNGAIIHIVDQKIERPTPEFFSYTLTKVALAAMTRLHALAFAPRVRVNAVAPGLTLPSGTQTESEFATVHDRTLLERGSTPADVAEAVCYLAEARAVTGQILYVDGGQRFQGAADDSHYVAAPRTPRP